MLVRDELPVPTPVIVTTRVWPTTVIRASVIRIRLGVVIPVVAVAIRGAADAELDARTLKVESLRQGWARAAERERADEAKRDHRLCQCSHDALLIYSRASSVPVRTPYSFNEWAKRLFL